MKVVGDFNNVSAALKPKLPKVGTVVEYQFLNGKRDYNNPKKMNYPFSHRLVTKDRIWDEGKQDFVDIGVYEKETRDKETGEKSIRTKAIWIPGGAAGLYAITIGSAAGDELYEFMEMTNQNRSKSNRDTSVEPLFYRIDAIGDAVEKTRRRSAKTEALLYVSNLDERTIREFAAAMAWGENDDLKLLTDQIGEFAETDPVAFLKFAGDEPELKNKALLKNAATKGIIKHDVPSNTVLWSNDTAIAQLQRQDGKTWVDSFAEWLRLSKGGDAIMSSIRKQINAAIKEKENEKKLESAS